MSKEHSRRAGGKPKAAPSSVAGQKTAAASTPLPSRSTRAARFDQADVYAADRKGVPARNAAGATAGSSHAATPASTGSAPSGEFKSRWKKRSRLETEGGRYITWSLGQSKSGTEKFRWVSAGVDGEVLDSRIGITTKTGDYLTSTHSSISFSEIPTAAKNGLKVRHPPAEIDYAFP